MTRTAVAVAILGLCLAWSPLAARQPAPGPDPVATFSILGVDPATGGARRRGAVARLFGW